MEQEMKKQEMMIYQNKAKTELKSYQVKLADLNDYIYDAIKYQNMKEGLKAVNMDGMPKSSGKSSNQLEEAIEQVDKKVEWLSLNTTKYLAETEQIENKIASIKYPERTVLEMKYKHNKKNWEIGEFLGKDKKTIQRYIDNGLILYGKI